LAWLLSGLAGDPVVGRELGDAGHGVAAFELVDDILEVDLGVDAEDEAVVTRV
jgi:hypothetical protein